MQSETWSVGVYSDPPHQLLEVVHLCKRNDPEDKQWPSIQPCRLVSAAGAPVYACDCGATLPEATAQDMAARFQLWLVEGGPA